MRLFSVPEQQTTKTHKSIDVYLEIGEKRTFAGAIDWPGWCRSGRDAPSALEALVAYGSRYARAIHTAHPDLAVPSDVSALVVVERVKGNATTDFGAPDIGPKRDRSPVDEAELARLSALLQACWHAFDATVAAAEGQTLRQGPRGGGRDRETIVRHVTEAQAAYIAKLGWTRKQWQTGGAGHGLIESRRAALAALAAAVRGEMPERGPRGGQLWYPRTFCRRVAWHVLDHAWELEDRILKG